MKRGFYTLDRQRGFGQSAITRKRNNNVAAKKARSNPGKIPVFFIFLFFGMASIRLLTYNIWFDQKFAKTRMQMLGSIIEQLDPDVIAFQEVTVQLLGYLKESQWSLKYPYWSAAPPSARYYTMMCSKSGREFRRFSHPQTTMGRDILIGTPISGPIEGAPIEAGLVVVTSHFESLPDMSIQREEQIRETIRRFASTRNVLVMGDTNISDAADGPNIYLPGAWRDAWLSTGRTHEAGFTRTPENPMSPPIGPNKNGNRLDRMFVRLSDYEIVDMQVVGNQEDPENPGIRPSDHYGLCATLRFKPDSQPLPPDPAFADDLPLFERPSNWKSNIG